MREGLALWVLFLGVAVLAPPACGQAASVEQARQDVAALCADAFEGRGAGTQGLAHAANYIEERFRALGLVPRGDEGYRQSFIGPNGTPMVNIIGALAAAPGAAGKGAAPSVAEPSNDDVPLTAAAPETTTADRHVVLAAHYDHLGKGKPGEANHGQIHPGADDNASGVAALLACAQQLKDQGPPSHTVLFIAFAGEESGLLGSAHYVEHPVLPLTSCTAMVNLDTVGRLFTNPLVVFGASTAQQLPEVLRGVNMGFNLNLQLPDKDPGGSDQMSFVRRGVPAVQLFTGPHADYHRPSDTADKIDYDGLERVAGFTSELVRYLADRDEPLGFVPPGAEAAAAQPGPAPRGSRRVTFGSIPDFNDKGPGVLLSGVIPGSPAEKAGMRAGDRIVEFAGVAIADLASYSDVLKGLNPGDEADVTFERGGQRQSVQVTVVERK